MRLFIGRLDKGTTEETLQTIFSRLGPIKKIEVREGSTSGIAFVYYQDDEDAKKAIEQLNGSEVDGAMITVEEARQKPAPAAPPARDMRYERDYRDRDRDPYGYNNQRYNDGPPAPQRSTKEVIVRHELRFRVHGVPQGATWRDLKDWSRVAGEVTFANVSNSVEGPIGVIEFVSADDYAKAKEVLEEAPLQGARVTLTKEVNEDGTLAPGVKLLPPSDAQRPRGHYSSSGGFDDQRGRAGAYPPRERERESRVYRESDYRPAPGGYYRDDHRGPPVDDHPPPSSHHAYDDRGRAPLYRDAPPRERERERDGYRGDDRGYSDYRSAAVRPRSRSRDRERADYDALPPRAPPPASYDSRPSGYDSRPPASTYDSRPPAYDYPPRAPVPAAYESSRSSYPPERRYDAPPARDAPPPRASYPPPGRDDRERERERERLPPPSEGPSAYPDPAYERAYR